MRRSDREVKDFDGIIRIMEKCDVCRIALNNNGYPYILPLNFGMKVDNNILKLDTVNIDYINTVDKPVGNYDLNRVIDCMKAFNGQLIIQTMFLKGTTDEGVDVDNTYDDYVLPWLETVKQIAPRQVMIYTMLLILRKLLQTINYF